jgi:hypothetical protein
VRYDAEKDMSISLPEHSDTSLVSFTIALNSSSIGSNSELGQNCSYTSNNFVGGGTWFRALDTVALEENSESVQNFHESGVVDVTAGQVVVFAGPLRHGGFPISKGTRYILVLFMYAESYPYQQYLVDKENNTKVDSHHKKDEEVTKVKKKSSYVVYRETLELMTTLNKLESIMW